MTFRTATVSRTLAALMRLLEERGIELLELHVRKATLEDVFIALTGDRAHVTRPNDCASSAASHQPDAALPEQDGAHLQLSVPADLPARVLGAVSLRERAARAAHGRAADGQRSRRRLLRPADDDGQRARARRLAPLSAGAGVDRRRSSRARSSARYCILVTAGCCSSPLRWRSACRGRSIRSISGSSSRSSRSRSSASGW